MHFKRLIRCQEKLRGSGFDHVVREYYVLYTLASTNRAVEFTKLTATQHSVLDPQISMQITGFLN